MYMEKFRLDGRVALVTGGGQGIGQACARALGEAGATVVVADLMPERSEKAVAELKDHGIAAVGFALDVTRSADVDAVPPEVIADHGRIDILVNNAGVAKSDVPAEETSDEHWRFHMDVNLDGLFWCCRAFGREMLKAARARSSTSARCPASSSTGRSRRPSTMPPRRRCTT